MEGFQVEATPYMPEVEVSAWPGKHRGWGLWRVIRLTVLILAYVFLLGPLFMVARQAFNSSIVFPAPFQDATLEWFRKFLAQDTFVHGLVVSGYIAVGAATLAVTLGLLAALAVTRGPTALRTSWATALLLSPVVVPQLVVGLAILVFISQLGLSLGQAGLVLAHATFLAPFAIRALSVALAELGSEHEEVAMTLGRRPSRAFAETTLRLLWPALVGSWFFTFTLSFVNVPLSLYLAPSGSLPLPIAVFQFMKSSLSPLVAAASVVLLVGVVAGTTVLEKVFKVRLLS